jgi:RNA 2',3'-cyclic 3'-phosphodiesterase
MRLFVAVPLPEAHKAAIRAYQQVYRDKIIRFVPEENLHLTLHFIGEVAEQALPGLQQQLARAAAAQPPFMLTFQETAPGPKLRFPRLIWTRFAEHPDFASLSTAICQALAAAPGAYGKFIPHITIARLRQDRGKLPALPVVQDPTVPDLAVSSFALWQSKLQSPHPAYSILADFPLTGPAHPPTT